MTSWHEREAVLLSSPKQRLICSPSDVRIILRCAAPSSAAQHEAQIELDCVRAVKLTSIDNGVTRPHHTLLARIQTSGQQNETSTLQAAKEKRREKRKEIHSKLLLVLLPLRR